MPRFTPMVIILVSALSSGCNAERMFSSPPRVQASPERAPISDGDVLYVLDGKVLQRDTADTAAMPKALRDLRPGDIQAIEVLKGQRARQRYGAAGENGVVVITTKSRDSR